MLTLDDWFEIFERKGAIENRLLPSLISDLTVHAQALCVFGGDCSMAELIKLFGLLARSAAAIRKEGHAALRIGIPSILLWNRYPHRCPDCGYAPICACFGRPSDDTEETSTQAARAHLELMPTTLDEWCRMLSKIYQPLLQTNDARRVPGAEAAVTLFGQLAQSGLSLDPEVTSQRAKDWLEMLEDSLADVIRWLLLAIVSCWSGAPSNEGNSISTHLWSCAIDS